MLRVKLHVNERTLAPSVSNVALMKRRCSRALGGVYEIILILGRLINIEPR